MAIKRPEHAMVVFDTNKYTGSFEREMCAFITGKAGECGVGEDIAEEVQAELKNGDWFEDNIADEVDEMGVMRPASIWPTTGRFNDGYGGHHNDTPEVRATLKGGRGESDAPAYESVAIFVEELPPAEVLQEMVARAKAFCKTRRVKYLGCRLVEPLAKGYKETRVANDGTL